MVNKTSYFHGGCRGLEPGECVLPATETGVKSVSGEGGGPYSPDYVYLSLTEQEARSYAALYIAPAIQEALDQGKEISFGELGGDVYEVEPLGKVVPDPDYPTPGRSWQTTSARVVRVIERGVPPSLD